MLDLIEKLARAGYHDVGFRFWKAGEAWGNGKVPVDTFYCRAWKSGTTVIIGVH